MLAAKGIISAVFALLLTLSSLTSTENAQVKEIPAPGFVYIDQAIPGIDLEIRYYTDHNFVGTRVDGYNAPSGILSKEATAALAGVQADLLANGMGLKIYDAYRPTQAVDHFVRWAQYVQDTKMKQEFYPDVDKKNLFNLGYIAHKSGHSRGSTVDLTIMNLSTGAILDMGGPFDFFGPVSHHDATNISETAKENRLLLKNLMIKHGFKPYAEEWWHYTLKNEPYPDTYFNFPIE